MKARLIKNLFSADVIGVLLVILALQMLAYGISSSLRGTDTTYLFQICLISAALGWLLSRRRLGAVYSAILIAALGLAGIWIVAARLMLPLIDLITSIAGLLPQIGVSIQEKIPLDTSATLEAWTVVLQASSALTARWQTWLLGVDKNVTVNDALIRNMIWSLLMWFLAAWTGWFAARRRAVLALIPNIMLLAVVLSYSEFRIYALWVTVIIMLLLMGLWNYKNHTAQWEQRRVDYSDSILYDNTQAVVFLAILVGSIAFSIPSISWRDVRDFLRERNSSEAAEMLGIRQQPVPKMDTVFQKPSLPREHLLTEGSALSQELVMTVRTGELPPVSDSVLTADVPRHYWRSTIYDEYQGAGWLTSYVFSEDYKANSPLVPGVLDGYRPLHLNIQLQQPEGKLFWSGILFSADVPFRADWRVRPQSGLFADQTELLQADMFAAAASAGKYQADAYIPLVTVEELRSLPADYPEDIRVRYLRLPRKLPERVHDLAKEITRGINNPYDKAKAIESYLRTNYPYDLEVPAPPADQDVADYFLFDLKRGYCDYYATAMVVLARASGLPARFVSGYSSGSYDAPNARYIVRELNAHSWAEIYFPEIGWIEFEPTASQPEIERIEVGAEIPATDTTTTPGEKFLFQLTSSGILYWISTFAILLFLVLLYFTVLERLWILSLDPVHAIAFLYKRYYRLGRPLAGARTRAETASEFTHKLIQKMEERRNRSSLTPPSSKFKAEARQFTSVYLLSLFSNHSIEKTDATTAYNMWRRLRPQLILARVIKFISERWKTSKR